MQVDALHCGACGNTCKETEECTAGSCKPTCGNGTIDPGEECDGAAPLECPAGYKPAATSCTASCKLDLSPCVLLTCGNNQVDPGEECDGPINTPCSSFGSGLFGDGQPQCQPNCKADISMCAYCGNGKLEEQEACEDGNLKGMSCFSLGAGSGTLACAQCQFDLTGCSGGLCGDIQGLDDKASWPAEGGCMKRPNSSRFEGPMLAPGAAVASSVLPGGNLGLAPVVTEDGLTLLTSALQVFVWNGQTAKVGFTATTTTNVAPVLLPGGSLLRLYDTGALVLERSGTDTWKVGPDQEHPGGAATTGAVVSGSTVFVGRADGSVWKYSLVTASQQVFYSSPSGVRGTMALDTERKTLYVPEDCSKINPNGICYLRAIDLDTGTLSWTSVMGYMSTNPCHAAVGAGGEVYTSCGESALFRSPVNPDAYNGGFSTSNGTKIQPPAIAKNGKVYLVSSKANGTSNLYAMSAQMKFLWPSPVDLGAKPLTAPLLDSKGNIHVCTDQHVASYAPSGALRWKYEWQSPTEVTLCSMVLSGPGRLDVATNSQVYRIQ